MRRADSVVTYSHYCQRFVENACADVDVKMIYHGVDNSVFPPLENRDANKVRHGLADTYVVGCVARNQPRKHYPILIETFARLCRDRPDALLYLHTDPHDIGRDILDLLKRAGINERTYISQNAAVDNGVNDARLNKIYNLFDVMALPSAAERFGLPLLEAMAARVPVFTTNHSAGAELVADKSELIDVKMLTTVGRYNLRHAIPDIDDLVTKLDAFYHNADRRSECRLAGRQFAQTLDWQTIHG